MCLAPKIDIPEPPEPTAERKIPEARDRARRKLRRNVAGATGNTVLTAPLGLPGNASSSSTVLGGA